MRHPLRGAVLQLLLVLPAAPGAVRSRDEAIAMRRAYSEAERRCAKTGLTLLRFDGGDESASSRAARAARSRVEAERFETELRRRGEGEGGRLMSHMGVLLAKLSNASLELALSSPRLGPTIAKHNARAAQGHVTPRHAPDMSPIQCVQSSCNST